MPRIHVAGAVLLALSFASAVGGAKPDVDVTALKRTCDGVLGTQIDSPAWRRLQSYVRDPRALDKLEFFCGAGWCGNSIPLRGGISLEFRCSAARKLYTAWAPDEMIVYFVSLKRGERTIYHRDLHSTRKA